MEVIFLRSFFKDIKKIKDQRLKQKVKDLIVSLENAETLEEVPNVIKMKGYAIAFRARIADYRLGLYYENQVIEIARFVKRNDIYKVFPTRINSFINRCK